MSKSLSLQWSEDCECIKLLKVGLSLLRRKSFFNKLWCQTTLLYVHGLSGGINPVARRDDVAIRVYSIRKLHFWVIMGE